MDPMTLIMFALIGVLIIFMFRNGRKRRAQMEELQTKMVPGAEVMLQSGIYATIDSIDEEANRATVTSGSSTFVVHRNAIGQVVTPVEDVSVNDDLDVAPDDDPAFGERLNNTAADGADENTDESPDENTDSDSGKDSDKQ